MPRRAYVLVVLAITAASLIWVISGIDVDEAARQLAAAGVAWLLPVQLLYLASHLLRVWRLQVILGGKVGFLRLFSIVSAGYLAIHVVPFRMGELVRPYLLQERAGVPFAAGLAAVFLERLCDVAMLAIMLLIVAFAFDLPPVVLGGVDVLRAAQRGAGVVLAGGMVGVVVAVYGGDALLSRVPRSPLTDAARRFRDGLVVGSGRPGPLALALALSVGVWAITIVAVQRSLAAFAGLPDDLGAALTTWSITLAGMSVVPTPGFFGGFEAACALALELLGAEASPARAFAVVLHLGQFAFTVVSGVSCLLVEGWSLRDLVSRSRAAAPTG